MKIRLDLEIDDKGVKCICTSGAKRHSYAEMITICGAIRDALASIDRQVVDMVCKAQEEYFGNDENSGHEWDYMQPILDMAFEKVIDGTNTDILFTIDKPKCEFIVHDDESRKRVEIKVNLDPDRKYICVGKEKQKETVFASSKEEAKQRCKEQFGFDAHCTLKEGPSVKPIKSK